MEAQSSLSLTNLSEVYASCCAIGHIVIQLLGEYIDECQDIVAELKDVEIECVLSFISV